MVIVLQIHERPGGRWSYSQKVERSTFEFTEGKSLFDDIDILEDFPVIRILDFLHEIVQTTINRASVSTNFNTLIRISALCCIRSQNYETTRFSFTPFPLYYFRIGIILSFTFEAILRS